MPGIAIAFNPKGERLSMSDPVDQIFTQFPEYETERLILRQIVSADAPSIMAIFGDEAVTNYYDLYTFTRMAEAVELIEYFSESYRSERQIRWGIVRKKDNQLIGTCGFVAIHTHRGEIGYDLASAYWRQGYMTEALEVLLEVGFDDMHLHRIEALVMVDNIASAGLLRKRGFTEEGILRDYDFFKEAFQDLRSFALLEGEFDSSYE